MACRSWFALCCVAALVASSSLAADKPSEAALRTAGQLWAVTDLILDQHVASPSRQELLLAAARSLCGTTRPPADLARKVSAITNAEELAGLLQAHWPKGTGGQPPDDQALGTFLVRAMLPSIPGQPELIPLDQYKAIEQLSHNRYVGTGIQLAMNPRENLTEILVPFPGGPARKAGAKPGDLILEVDGKDVAKLPLGKVVELLRGEEGSQVNVVVRQTGSNEKRTLMMTRGVVPLPLLVGYQRAGEEEWNYRVQPDAPIAYVRVSRLTTSALHELRQIERRVQADGCKALILDLRFTLEGDIPPAALVADAFLENGLVCKVRDREDNVKEYKADPDCHFRNWPVAVLTSPVMRGPGTEALAAALQAHGRAILVGERSRGDRLVASAVKLPDDLGVLRLATATVELPSPKPRHAPLAKGARGPMERAPGLEPDHAVPTTPRQREAVMTWQFEQDRPGRTAEKSPEDAVLAKAVELLQAALKAAEAK